MKKFAAILCMLAAPLSMLVAPAVSPTCPRAISRWS